MRHQATRGAVSPPIPRPSRASLRLEAAALERCRGQAREQGGGRYQTVISAAWPRQTITMVQPRSIGLKSVAASRGSTDGGAASS
jgi:hypothetical protein